MTHLIYPLTSQWILKFLVHLDSCEGWCNVHPVMTWGSWCEFWILIQRCYICIIVSSILKKTFPLIYLLFVNSFVHSCVCLSVCIFILTQHKFRSLSTTWKNQFSPSTTWDKSVRLGVKCPYLLDSPSQPYLALTLGFPRNTQNILCKICTILIFPMAHTHLSVSPLILDTFSSFGWEMIQSPISQCLLLFLDKILF